MKEYFEVITNYGIWGMLLVLVSIIVKSKLLTYLTASDFERLFWSESMKGLSKAVHRIITLLLSWLLINLLGIFTRFLPHWFEAILMIALIICFGSIAYIWAGGRFKKLKFQYPNQLTEKIDLLFVSTLTMLMLLCSQFIYQYDLTRLGLDNSDYFVFILVNTLVFAFIVLEAISLLQAMLKHLKKRYCITIQNEIFELVETLSNGLMVLKSTNDDSIKLIEQKEITKYRINQIEINGVK